MLPFVRPVYDVYYAALCRAALSAEWVSKVPFNATAPIPLAQLWQTSRHKQLSKRAAELRSSWTSLNPSMQATLMDNAEAADFVQSFFGNHVHAVYAAFPLGVMRADFWRYAILYAHGGVYADVDTKCHKPVQEWFPPRITGPQDPVFVVNASTWQAAGPLQYFNLTWSDCSLVAAVENDVHMCQWIIASVPGHPVLRAALQVALRSVKNGFDCTYEHMVHAHTGPAVWTQAFRDVLGLPGDVSAAGISRAVWTNATVYQRARELKLCIVAPTFWGAPYNTKAQNAHNLYSSQWAEGNPNVPWVKEREHVTAIARRSVGRVRA